eukprot:5414216-Pleurochrysis_carterae.AAC.1
MPSRTARPHGLSFNALAFIRASFVMTADTCCFTRTRAKANGGQGGDGQRARTNNRMSAHTKWHVTIVSSKDSYHFEVARFLPCVQSGM